MNDSSINIDKEGHQRQCDGREEFIKPHRNRAGNISTYGV
jgi:hypothetical protein